MAEKRLQLIFEDSSRVSGKVTISIPKCDDTTTPAVIKAAMQVMCDNKEVIALDLGDPLAARWVTPADYVDVTLPA